MASSAVKARLKALRKKHGLGEFRKASRSKVVSMAKRKKGRKSARVFARSHKRGYRKSSRSTGWLPLSTTEMALDFGIGAALGPISARTTPLAQQYLGQYVGRYAPEAGLAVAGVLAHKFGGKLHPLVAQGGKELFRFAVISSGQKMGGSLVNSMIGAPATGSAEYL